jgi:hypothetical protein
LFKYNGKRESKYSKTGRKNSEGKLMKDYPSALIQTGKKNKSEFAADLNPKGKKKLKNHANNYVSD